MFWHYFLANFLTICGLFLLFLIGRIFLWAGLSSWATLVQHGFYIYGKTKVCIGSPRSELWYSIIFLNSAPLLFRRDSFPLRTFPLSLSISSTLLPFGFLFIFQKRGGGGAACRSSQDAYYAVAPLPYPLIRVLGFVVFIFSILSSARCWFTSRKLSGGRAHSPPPTRPMSSFVLLLSFNRTLDSVDIWS